MAVEIPRPPAPDKNGDQSWPTTARPPANAASTGRSCPASSGPSAPLADIEHAGHGERAEPRDLVEPGARHRSAVDGAQVDTAGHAGRDVREGNRADQEGNDEHEGC